MGVARAALIVVVAFAFDAFARPAKPVDDAKEAARQGTLRFKAGQYQEALGFFLISYAKKKDPVVIWNIGRCYEELGDYPQALKYFEEFHASAHDEAARQKAEAKIAAMKERIGPPPEPAKPPEPERPPEVARPPEPEKVGPGGPQGLAGERVSMEKRAQSVVKVLAMGLPRFARADAGGVVPVALPDAGYGSGVVVSNDCIVLTNRHVVEGKVAVAVRFEGNDRVFPAVVAHKSDLADCAVLVVDRVFCPDTMPISAPPQGLERGQSVYRIGYGGELPGAEVHTRAASVKRGVVSRKVEVNGGSFLEIDAPVNPGDSGGPVLTEDGAFAGLTVAKVSGVEGVGFAIPAAVVQQVVNDDRVRKDIAQAREGMQGRDWEGKRSLSEICADLVETTPDDLLQALLATESKRQRTLEAFKAASSLSEEVGLLTAAAVWNVGAWLVVKGDKSQRQVGWDLLERCREAAHAVSKKGSLASNDFVVNVDNAYKTLKGYGDKVVLSKPPPKQQVDVPRWELRVGRTYEFYFHWLLLFHKVRDEEKHQLANFAAGFQLPIVGNGRFEAGIGVGYGFSWVDEVDKVDNVDKGESDILHRILFPIRARYWFLIADVGPQMVYHKQMDSSGDKKGKLQAGALVRVGFSVGADLGFEYDYVPVLNDYEHFYGLYMGFCM